ncbi:MAG: hypothetical protein COA78_37300 [Blastopirellula sp.]|nr:MAG: hypothetical protein COA78_37300 [Blastopirellula sp.]
MISFQNTVGGRQVTTTSTFESFDPYTGKPWALIPSDGTEQVDAAVGAAKAAFYSKEWCGLTATERGKLLYRFADIVSENIQRYCQVVYSA